MPQNVTRLTWLGVGRKGTQGASAPAPVQNPAWSVLLMEVEKLLREMEPAGNKKNIQLH